MMLKVPKNKNAFSYDRFNETYDLNFTKDQLTKLQNQLFQLNGTLYEQVNDVAMCLALVYC